MHSPRPDLVVPTAAAGSTTAAPAGAPGAAAPLTLVTNLRAPTTGVWDPSARSATLPSLAGLGPGTSYDRPPRGKVHFASTAAGNVTGDLGDGRWVRGFTELGPVIGWAACPPAALAAYLPDVLDLEVALTAGIMALPAQLRRSLRPSLLRHWHGARLALPGALGADATPRGWCAPGTPTVDAGWQAAQEAWLRFARYGLAEAVKAEDAEAKERWVGGGCCAANGSTKITTTKTGAKAAGVRRRCHCESCVELDTVARRVVTRPIVRAQVAAGGWPLTLTLTQLRDDDGVAMSYWRLGDRLDRLWGRWGRRWDRPQRLTALEPHASGYAHAHGLVFGPRLLAAILTESGEADLDALIERCEAMRAGGNKDPLRAVAPSVWAVMDRIIRGTPGQPTGLGSWRLEVALTVEGAIVETIKTKHDVPLPPHVTRFRTSKGFGIPAPPDDAPRANISSGGQGAAARAALAAAETELVEIAEAQQQAQQEEKEAKAAVEAADARARVSSTAVPDAIAERRAAEDVARDARATARKTASADRAAAHRAEMDTRKADRAAGAKRPNPARVAALRATADAATATAAAATAAAATAAEEAQEATTEASRLGDVVKATRDRRTAARADAAVARGTVRNVRQQRRLLADLIRAARRKVRDAAKAARAAEPADAEALQAALRAAYIPPPPPPPVDLDAVTAARRAEVTALSSTSGVPLASPGIPPVDETYHRPRDVVTIPRGIAAALGWLADAMPGTRITGATGGPDGIQAASLSNDREPPPLLPGLAPRRKNEDLLSFCWRGTAALRARMGLPPLLRP